MYLEKLEIQGFKSFANKNSLVFPGIIEGTRRGLTAIVGPNGSGKSNTADAVRWALGEQSIKTLRGKKSDDVIFSGSDQKSRLGMAEVSLYLNNSDSRRKPKPVVEGEEAGPENHIDALLSKEEIVITRRIFRDGESEYLINNSRARLTDIQMLLAKASFGQKTYSVIGQGMVEGFLNTSLSERKDFFDEATGVKQYQIKRDIALNKLQGSYENLNQVEILLNEIEPRLRSLTRQVDKLKKREEIETALNSWHNNYYGYNWHALNDRLNEINGRYLELEKNKITKEDRLLSLNSELSQIESQPAIGDDFNQLHQSLSLKRDEEETLTRQFSRLENWLRMRSEMPENSDPRELEKDKTELVSQINDLQVKIESAKNKDNGSDDLNEKRRVLSELQSDRDSAEKDLSKLNAWLEMKMESSGQFDLSFLNNKKQELTKEIVVSDEELVEIQNFVSTSRDKLNQLISEREVLLAQIIEQNKSLRGISLEVGDSEIGKINEQLKLSIDKLELAEKESDLEKMRVALNEIRQDIKAILELSSGAKGQSELSQIQSQMELLNQQKEDLSAKINNLNLEISSKEQLSRLLIDRKRQAERELSGISQKLSQSESSVDTKGVEKQKAELENKIGGFNAKIKSAKEELENLNRKSEERRDNIFSQQKELQHFQNKVNIINNKLNEIRINFAKYETRLEDLESALKKNSINDNLTEINEAQVQKEKSDIMDRLELLKPETQVLREKIDKFNSEQQNKRDHLLSLQKNVQNLQYEINGLAGELSDLKVNAARQETKLEDLENNIRISGLDLSVIRNKRPEGNIDLSQAEEEINRLKHQLDLIGGIDPEIAQEYNTTKERYDFLFAQTSDLNDAIKSLEKIIYELDLTIKERFDTEFKIISEKFTEYFKILFNGGSAKIVKVMATSEDSKEDSDSSATEEDEKTIVLNQKQLDYNNLNKIKFLKKHNATGLAGIEIEATPPGKKIKSVSMLSGGERALTAIALISAIISANPSPFVVLDEVDAALDEANSERLAKILDDLSNKTQFIVITHNRASMRKASVLYGVTMQADGISQLLSVKLDDIKSDR
ncbi:MAG: AAA family ATPase [Patescibacteria group bacterium]